MLSLNLYNYLFPMYVQYLFTAYPSDNETIIYFTKI